MGYILIRNMLSVDTGWCCWQQETANAENSTSKTRRFLLLIFLTIANAFSSLPWKNMFDTLVKARVPSHLAKMIFHYLRDKKNYELSSHRWQGYFNSPLTNRYCKTQHTMTFLNSKTSKRGRWKSWCMQLT